MDPFPGGLLPVKLLLEAGVEVFDRFQVAEANLQAVPVGGEGVDRVSLDHVAAGGALELAEVGEPRGHLHVFDGLEAVLEYVRLAEEEGEPFGPLLHLHLRALFVLVNDEPAMVMVQNIGSVVGREERGEVRS